MCRVQREGDIGKGGFVPILGMTWGQLEVSGAEPQVEPDFLSTEPAALSFAGVSQQS